MTNPVISTIASRWQKKIMPVFPIRKTSASRGVQEGVKPPLYIKGRRAGKDITKGGGGGEKLLKRHTAFISNYQPPGAHASDLWILVTLIFLLLHSGQARFLSSEGPFGAGISNSCSQSWHLYRQAGGPSAHLAHNCASVKLFSAFITEVKNPSYILYHPATT